MSKQYIAHVKTDANGLWELPHILEEHLRCTAELARSRANSFQSHEWAELAGLWHDLGKFREPFQQYIREQTGFDRENAHVEQGPKRVTHSTAGAVHAVQKLGPVYGHILAYLIAGHHAGLPDWTGGRGSLRFRLQESDEEYTQSLSETIPPDILEGDLPDLPEVARGSHAIHLWMRLLFSCLVDADFLDTEQYMSPERANRRQADTNLSTLSGQFFQHMNSFRKAATPGPLNTIRQEIYDECLKAAENEPGIFSLTVPTGGGKTLSSLAFALAHARRHNKRRVIYAIPFTSIIEQNAAVFRNILGEEAVLEHHSNLDDSARTETGRSRLASENWDAPLIVTTNVQLFESLFSSRTSRSRKLHNIVNSIIILDEAQQLPRQFHRPITQTMRQLSDFFGVTWLLCTATQPELGEQKDAFDRTQHEGLGTVHEIIAQPAQLAEKLKRVEVIMPEPDAEPLSWDAVGEAASQEECVLVIVNTRNHARELYNKLPDDGDNVHLSANMCPEHRSAVITNIRHRLAQRQKGDSRPLRVVSTQLIEAGVDVDFPVVYRAMAGLDSIAQSAGRCNREGTLAGKGTVTVFLPEQSAPPGFLRQGEQITLSLLHAGQLTEPLSPDSIARYFNALNRKGSRDEHGICDLLRAEQTNDSALDISFRSAAEKFRLIDDNGVGVIAPYCPEGLDESPVHDWLEQLEADSSARWLHRKLQRFSITLPESFAEKLQAQGALYPKAGKLVIETGQYHNLWGIQPPDQLMAAEETIIG